MTPAAEIARLRELLAAGALPAVVRTVHTPVFSLAFDAADCVVFRVTVEGQGEEARQVASDSCRASAEARNALPALLDDLEAARGLLDDVKGLLIVLANHHGDGPVTLMVETIDALLAPTPQEPNHE